MAMLKERKGESLNVKMKEQVWVDGSDERVRGQQFEGENDDRIRVIAILFCWEVWYKYFRLGMISVPHTV
jgi:hypothetical protein